MRISDWSSDVCSSDLLLKCVAAKIGDLLPSGALAARFGGDEFACAMLFDPDHPDTVERMAERLVSRLAEPTAVRPDEPPVGTACVSTCRRRWSASHLKTKR